MKIGLRELLLAAPHREFVAPYDNKILPLKDQLSAKHLKFEIMKTGSRMWLTVRLTPEADIISMNDLSKIKDKIDRIAKEVYENTQTEIVLEAT